MSSATRFRPGGRTSTSRASRCGCSAASRSSAGSSRRRVPSSASPSPVQAVTLLLGIAFLACAAVWPEPGIVRAVLAWLGYINLMLLVFNMIPAIPLDGGRVLRSALWARDGNLAKATHRATRIGALLAWVLIGLGLVQAFAGLFQGLWFAVIGWFVLTAGRAEEQRVVVEGALADVSVAQLMTVSPITVPAHSSLADVASRLAGTARQRPIRSPARKESSGCSGRRADRSSTRGVGRHRRRRMHAAAGLRSAVHTDHIRDRSPPSAHGQPVGGGSSWTAAGSSGSSRSPTSRGR